MASRLLGLVREQFFAFLFGAGLATDAFNVAFRIPNLLRDLFAEGAMSSAFVPTLTKTMTRDGLSAAWRLANLVIHALLVVVSLIVIAGLVWSEEIINLYASSFGEVPGKLALTVLLTRIMMPFLLLVAFAAAAMGCLNARGRFFVPAIAPAMFNIATIVMGVLIWRYPGAFGSQPIIWMAIAALIGGAGQIAIQVPFLWKEGYRFRFVTRLGEIFGDPGVKRILTLMLPATIGLAATQVNIFVNTYFATSIPSAVSWLNYAFRLMQLPLGLFGVAIAVATLPAISRHVAEENHGEFRRTLQHSLRLVFAINVPASIGLAVLGAPIIRLIFEHGRFLPSDTNATVVALPRPTEREKTCWYFQRYVAHLPAAGELVLFDRSWYNRAGVERVMGFCSDFEYQEFLQACPEFERILVRSGIMLVKYWFSVSDVVQEKRFQRRMEDRTRSWKLSPMDVESRARWVEYSMAKDVMFAHTPL